MSVAEDTTERTQQRTPSPRSVDRTPEEEALARDHRRSVEALLERVTAEDTTWGAALRSVLASGVTAANVETWFTGTRLEGTSTVVVKNAFVRDWLEDERHGYAQLLRDILGVDVVRFVLEGQQAEEPAAPESTS
jgi:hypothetical protein